VPSPFPAIPAPTKKKSRTAQRPSLPNNERCQYWLVPSARNCRSARTECRANQTLASTGRIPETGIELLPCRIYPVLSVALDERELDAAALFFLRTTGKRLFKRAPDRSRSFIPRSAAPALTRLKSGSGSLASKCFVKSSIALSVRNPAEESQ
jgi:hypothetical protein